MCYLLYCWWPTTLSAVIAHYFICLLPTADSPLYQVPTADNTLLFQLFTAADNNNNNLLLIAHYLNYTADSTIILHQISTVDSTLLHLLSSADNTLLHQLSIADSTLYQLSTTDSTLLCLSTADNTLRHQLSTADSTLHQLFTADSTLLHLLSSVFCW